MQMYFDRSLAETNISANNYEWYKTVFAPTAPAFIVEEQVCFSHHHLPRPPCLTPATLLSRFPASPLRVGAVLMNNVTNTAGGYTQPTTDR